MNKKVLKLKKIRPKKLTLVSKVVSHKKFRYFEFSDSFFLCNFIGSKKITYQVHYLIFLINNLFKNHIRITFILIKLNKN